MIKISKLRNLFLSHRLEAWTGQHSTAMIDDLLKRFKEFQTYATRNKLPWPIVHHSGVMANGPLPLTWDRPSIN